MATAYTVSRDDGSKLHFFLEDVVAVERSDFFVGARMISGDVYRVVEPPLAKRSFVNEAAQKAENARYVTDLKAFLVAGDEFASIWAKARGA
jgi:hypothetical protein